MLKPLRVVQEILIEFGFSKLKSFLRSSFRKNPTLSRNIMTSKIVRKLAISRPQEQFKCLIKHLARSTKMKRLSSFQQMSLTAKHHLKLLRTRKTQPKSKSPVRPTKWGIKVTPKELMRPRKPISSKIIISSMRKSNLQIFPQLLNRCKPREPSL